MVDNSEYLLKVAGMELYEAQKMKEITERYNDRKLKEAENDLLNRLKNK